MDGGNFDLKEEIRDYWSKRSETFDLAFGHKIAAGAEANAWRSRSATWWDLSRNVSLN